MSSTNGKATLSLILTAIGGSWVKSVLKRFRAMTNVFGNDLMVGRLIVGILENQRRRGGRSQRNNQKRNNRVRSGTTKRHNKTTQQNDTTQKEPFGTKHHQTPPNTTKHHQCTFQCHRPNGIQLRSLEILDPKHQPDWFDHR